MSEVTWYSVAAEIEQGVDEGDIDALLDALAAVGAEGGVVSAGARLSVRFSLAVEGANGTPIPPGRVVEPAWEMLAQALSEAGVASSPVSFFSIETDEHLEREVSEPLDPLLGVTEVAEILGVSKQRVGQLRERGDFPSPIAELAAGPVWARSMLLRFIDKWPRKAGRPPKARASAG